MTYCVYCVRMHIVFHLFGNNFGVLNFLVWQKNKSEPIKHIYFCHMLHFPFPCQFNQHFIIVHIIKMVCSCDASITLLQSACIIITIQCGTIKFDWTGKYIDFHRLIFTLFLKKTYTLCRSIFDSNLYQYWYSMENIVICCLFVTMHSQNASMHAREQKASIDTQKKHASISNVQFDLYILLNIDHLFADFFGLYKIKWSTRYGKHHYFNKFSINQWNQCENNTAIFID